MLAAAPTLTPQQQQRLIDRDGFGDQRQSLMAEGKFRDAARAQEKALAIERSVLGDDHFDTLHSLIVLADCNALDSGFKAARDWANQALSIQQRSHDEHDWRVASVRRLLAYIDRIEKMPATDRKRLCDAEQASAQAALACNRQKYKDAIALGRKAWEAKKALLGGDDPESLAEEAQLGYYYRSNDDFADAEPLLKHALDRRQAVLGPNDPDVAVSSNSLGYVYVGKKDYPTAESLFRRAVELYRGSEGPDSLDYAQSLDNLAELYVRSRSYRRAEALRSQALDIDKRALGENHPKVAHTLLALSFIYSYQHEYDQAAKALAETQSILKKNHREKDFDYVESVLDLAYVDEETKKYAEALPLDLEALGLQRQLFGDQSRAVGVTLYHISSVYIGEKDYVKALDYQRQALAVFRAVEGDKSQEVLTSLDNVAWLEGEIGYAAQKRYDFAAARAAYREQIKNLTALLGESNWRVTDARISLAVVDDIEKLTPVQRKELEKADAFFDQAQQIGPGRAREALVPAEKSLTIYRSLFGEEHAKTLNGLSMVSFLYVELDQFAKAKPIYIRVSELEKKIRGPLHPNFAISLQNLGHLYYLMGDLTQSLATLNEALVVEHKIFGPSHAYCAETLNSLGVVNDMLGRYADAESCYRQATDIRKETIGEDDPEYAHSLLNLGFFYTTSLQDFGKAEPLLRQAVAIYKRRLGTKNLDYARGIDFLASMLTNAGRFQEAESLYREAIDIRKDIAGPESTTYAVSLHNLAVLYLSEGQPTKAEPFFQQALAIDKRRYGEHSAAIASELNSLTGLYASEGRYSEAIAFDRELLAIRQKSFGERSLGYAEALGQLARDSALSGDATSAMPGIVEALQIAQKYTDEQFGGESERQQLAMRSRIGQLVNRLMFVSIAAKAPADQVYGQWLNWKGVVSARQRQLREIEQRLEKSGKPELAKVSTELADATGTLASLSQTAGSDDPERRFRMDELSDKVESLQKKLAEASGEYRAAREQQHCTVDDLRHVLPADSALVDFIEYTQIMPGSKSSPGKTDQQMLAAFVVQPNQPVVRVELGPIEPIEQAIGDWRSRFGRKGTDGDDPGQDLRRIVWQPLEEHFHNANTILISPYGQTAMMPWSALPGDKPGSYLIDQVAIAVVPVPSRLPELLSSSKPNVEARPSLLVVGDVDFDSNGIDAAPKTGSLAYNLPRGGTPLHWSSLPGTRDEISAVEQSFRERFPDVAPAELKGASAVKSAIVGRAAKSRYLHFATHGFFAPPQLRSALSVESKSASRATTNAQSISGYDPGLLSGLVLAGANRQGFGDGILTALEVEQMDLSNVELATLSACETGLGESAGGEGLLGLQRAFQNAGARAVVAGLWKVPDKATQMLMSRFYDNLWNKKMTKLGALREAQRSLLHDAENRAGRARGLELPTEESPSAHESSASPYYWAAFVLSGDWR